jgi:L-rhamnose-H+ transport protein
MNPITPNPLLGVALHAVGATFAATCYTPEKRVRGWSWQSYWLTQALAWRAPVLSCRRER